MRKATNILTLSLTIAGWTSFILLFYFLFQDGKEKIQIQMDFALEKAITSDYHERLNKKLIAHRPLGRKIKGSQIKTEEGIETITFKDSIDEFLADQLITQYTLIKSSPINPDNLSNIFKNEINNNEIIGKKGIIYCHNGKKQYSDNDSISPQSAILTSPQIIDAKETASVQAWVDCSWITVLRNTTSKALWSVIAYGIVLLGVSISFYVDEKKKKKVIEKGENIQIGDLLLQKDMEKMYIKGVECPIRRADFKLLLLFVQAPNQLLTLEDIKNAFWSNEDDPDNKIYSHISTLRSALKDFPNYQIKREGKEYRLILPDVCSINKIIRSYTNRHLQKLLPSIFRHHK